MNRKKKSAGRSPAPSVALVTTVTRPTPSRPARKRRSNATGLQSNGRATQAFLRSLSDPFNHGCPQIAVNNLTLDGTANGWRRIYGLTVSANGYSATILSPTACLGDQPGIAIASSPASFVTHIQPAASSTVLNTVTGTANISSYGQANVNDLNASFTSTRCKTAGMRVSVRYPTTGAPGRLIGLRITDTLNNITAQSLDTLVELSDAHSVVNAVAGACECELRWAWGNEYETDFQAKNNAPPLSVITTYCVVIGVGWPTGSVLDVEAIAHYDVQNGVLVQNTGTAQDMTMVLSEPIERLAQVIKGIRPVADQFSILLEDGALSSAVRRHVSRRRGLFGSSSSSSATGSHTFHESVQQTAEYATSAGTTDYVHVATGLAGSAAAAGAAYLARQALGRGADGILQRMRD